MTPVNDESSAQRLEPGLDVGGRFVLDQLLGEGGMGWVWAATETATGRKLALKILKGGREEDRRRFLRELRAAAAIRHPNVVRIDEVLEIDLSPEKADKGSAMVMVLELLEGETLGEVIRRDGRIGLVRLAEILLPVTDALEAAHAAGIVHRDLKPDNVFLAGDGVRVLDFGVAKLTASEGLAARTQALTGTGSMIGTPYYMSPEQVEAEKDLDARSDIWSLGVMTYECLSGIRPTEADTVGRVLKRILMADFEPIEKRCPDLPADVTAIVRAMLTSDRALRLKDLGEVRRILRPYATGEAVPSSQPRSGPASGTNADPFARTERADSRADTHGAVSVAPASGRTRTRLFFGAAAIAAAASGITFMARSSSSPAAVAPALSAGASSLPSTSPSPSPSPATSPAPTPSASASALPSPAPTPSASPAAPPVVSGRAAGPRCLPSEALSHGHCCARGLAWDGTRCERPLATTF